MSPEQHRPRLRSLDEMPRPRVTVRQRYFRVKTRFNALVGYGPMRAWLTLAVLLLLLWGIARATGFPIEERVSEWLARF